MKTRKMKVKPKKKSTKEKPTYKCPHCKKKFTDKSTHRLHISLHTDDLPYECEICHYKCKIRKYLSRHMKKVHTKATGHQCKYCGKCFHYECKLRDHMRVHTGEKPFKCNLCDKAFSSTYSLSGHKLIHTGEKPFQCSFCDYACRDNSTIRRHQERHMGIIKTYPCSMCKRQFKKKESLQLHVDEVHFELDTRKHPCGQCDKIFKTKGTLRIHLNTVHSSANRVMCEICDTYITKTNIQAHMRRHIDVRPYKCSFKTCGRRFKDKGDLTKHSRIHYPDRQYLCSVCDKRFARKNRLNNHMLLHSRKNRVQCDYCGVIFSTKMYLSRHIKKEHGPDAKTYICDICNLVTYNKRSITMHIQYGHVTEEDSICQLCNKDFGKYLNLAEHYSRRHNIKYTIIKKKKDEVAVKEEPEEYVNNESTEFMYEVDIRKHEPDEDMFEETIKAPSPPTYIEIDTDIITYSKKVLSEDVSRSLLERNKDVEVDDFNDFFIGHVLEKPEEIVEIPREIVDEEKKERVKQCVEKLLSEVRLKKETKAMEKMRRQYNKRIKKATKCGKKEEPKSIRYFKKPEAKNVSESHNDANIDKAIDQNVDKIIDKPIDITVVDKSDDVDEIIHRNDKTNVNSDDVSGQKSDNNNGIDQNVVDKDGDQNIVNDVGDQNNVDGSNIVDKVDIVGEIVGNPNMVDDKVGDPDIDDNKIAEKNTVEDKVDDEQNNDNDDIDDENDDDYRDSDESDAEANPNGKLKFNTHQCYICFKLFKTKTDLKRHCSDHFDICNEKMLKKCPFCGYVTNLQIQRHIKLVHKVTLDIPYARIKERNTQNGSKYVFEIDENCDLEIIPSVSNLNKIASMKIDEKNRETKNAFLGTTKLIRKGSEWVVEKQAVNVNSDYLIPKFTEDDYKKIKFIGDNYLERIKTLSMLAKNKGVKILYPCSGCEKICLTLSALKLHNRKHESNPKAFKPKVWKNKILNGINGKLSSKTLKKHSNLKKNMKRLANQSNSKSRAVQSCIVNSNVVIKPVGRRNLKIAGESRQSPAIVENRFADPNPVRNKHKCDKELIEFYKNNIKGGDIEFWQFLKIFNKMSRENVNDFEDLENRTDFGMHKEHNATDITEPVIAEKPKTKTVKNSRVVSKKPRKSKKNLFTRSILISKKHYLRRIELQNEMRRNIELSKSLNK